MRAEELERVRAAAPMLAEVLRRIYNADASGNNGAFMGEAILCGAFRAQAAEALRIAGLLPRGADYALHLDREPEAPPP